MRLYTRSDKGGHSDGTCSLGECFLQGLGTKQDQAQAVRLFQKAAGKGNTRAAYLLAQCLEEGTGTARDLKQARELYQKAADQGHKKAKEALARLDTVQDAPAKPAKPEPKKERKGWWPFGKK